jgi:hypothetical protein
MAASKVNRRDVAPDKGRLRAQRLGGPKDQTSITGRTGRTKAPQLDDLLEIMPLSRDQEQQEA